MSTPMKFRKKPITIEAMQYKFGDGSWSIIEEFCGEEQFYKISGGLCHLDWVIKWIKGECYICKPDIFELTYEKVEQDIMSVMALPLTGISRISLSEFIGALMAARANNHLDGDDESNTDAIQDGKL